MCKTTLLRHNIARQDISVNEYLKKNPAFKKLSNCM